MSKWGVVFICWLFSSTLWAATSSYSVLIGERFPYDLSVVVPRDSEVIFPTSNTTFSPFEIKAFGISKAGGAYEANGLRATKLIGSYTLTAYDVGTLFIPTVTVLVKEKTGGGQVVFPPVKIEVKPVPGTEQQTALKEVKPPLSIPYTGWEIGLFLLALLAVVVGAWWAWKYVKSRENPPAALAPERVLTPYESAYQKLMRIGTQSLDDQESYKLFYIAISEALREYLQQQFGIEAMEMTTSELLAALKQFRLAWEEVDQLRAWLTHSDWVKFAKHRPESETALDHHRQALVLLERFAQIYQRQQQAASPDAAGGPSR